MKYMNFAHYYNSMLTQIIFISVNFLPLNCKMSKIFAEICIMIKKLYILLLLYLHIIAVLL